MLRRRLAYASYGMALLIILTGASTHISQSTDGTSNSKTIGEPGSVITPPSNTISPGQVGSHAHTNVEIFVPPKGLNPPSYGNDRQNGPNPDNTTSPTK